ncbi:hypothetical protein HII31_13024 [Pseudocercospora fuligena]|uniref:Uncharacterized protein n=1 Tax=Pseudocercospora fuligena TaxID=685502 RepID=A0A8H6R746_9PEZI|nr:hypothetical protein HII31_13024 [Pseudocercospora fuligena]
MAEFVQSLDAAKAKRGSQEKWAKMIFEAIYAYVKQRKAVAEEDINTADDIVSKEHIKAEAKGKPWIPRLCPDLSI